MGQIGCGRIWERHDCTSGQPATVVLCWAAPNPTPDLNSLLTRCVTPLAGRFGDQPHRGCSEAESGDIFPGFHSVPSGLGPATFTQRSIRRPPIVKGGSPPKKRHMRSPPPFALHLQYAPTSGSDWKRSCGRTRPLPSEGKLPETTFPRYTPMVGPSDDSASNPGMFISNLLIVFRFNGHGKSPECSEA